MDQFTNQLNVLQEKIARKSKLQDMIVSLQNERISLESEENILESACRKEQTDVNKLEGVSLSALYYSITGRKEEQMEKERREAHAAAAKHNKVCAQLRAVNQDIQRYTDELMELSSCESEYEHLLNEKAEYIKKTDLINGPEILRLEEHMRILKAQNNEIDEAYSIGECIINQIQDIMESLDRAEGWGTWDLFGGGLISTMAKHSNLDNAEQQIQQLQDLLGRYKTELADVKIHAKMQAKIEGFLYFADFFFDGLFADWAVLDRIQNSQSQVEDTHNQVKQIQSQLNTIRREIQNKIQQTQADLNQIVLNH